jgi:hypothetical protein
VAPEPDDIAQDLLEKHPDAVALVGFTCIRGDKAIVSADSELTLSMSFPLEDVVAQRDIPTEEEAEPETDPGPQPEGSVPTTRSVILVKADVMRTPILQRSQREELAARFLSGAIGAEVLIPGTLEGAAYRLGVAYSIQCPRAMCSLGKASPRC